MAVAPLVWGFYALAMISVLYEPTRTSLYHLGQDVGGVGGVGGLTNQWGPTPNCTTTEGGYDAPWCFQPGRLGFTPFAGVMLALITVPLAISALATPRHSTKAFDLVNELIDPGDKTSRKNLLFLLRLSWQSMSMLWFIVPLCAYTASTFFQKDVWHVICAIAICAAFPLSWHMSFVAIPASSAPFLSPLLGISTASLKKLHIHIAWSALSWAGVHAGGELIYLISQRSFVSSLSLTGPAWNDNLIFVLGLSTACLFVVHALYAQMRKHPQIQQTFQRNHRFGAAILLLSASAHWWPFVFFLAPAISCAATGLAVRAVPNCHHHCSSRALASATLAAVIGIAIVWGLRQECMVHWRPGDYSIPFMFPPAAVILAFLFARGAAAITLHGVGSNKVPVKTPLLDGSESSSAHIN